MEFDGSDLSNTVLASYEQETAEQQRRIRNKGIHATVTSKLVEAAQGQGLTEAGTTPIVVEGDLEAPQGFTDATLRATGLVSYDDSTYRLACDQIKLELHLSGSNGQVPSRLGDLSSPPPAGEHCGLINESGELLDRESHDWAVGLINEAFSGEVVE